MIPVYNGSNYLARAIDSALAQTYQNIEIIVVNDGSTDNGETEKLALSYGDKIRYFYKENGGVSTALNLGIQNMRGEWFSWLSHDDLYTSEKIQKQIDTLQGNEQKKVLVLCDTSFIDENNHPLTKKVRELPGFEYTNAEMLHEIFSGYAISGCALLIPKVAFDEAGLFDLELRYMQDLEMWYRIMFCGYGFIHNSDCCVLSRIHKMQTTVTGKLLGKKDSEIVGKYLVDKLLDIGNDQKCLLKKYMFRCMKMGNFKIGEYAIIKLKESRIINIFDILKAKIIKGYGKLRPLLVETYYRLFYKIKFK
ncbi:MAG: glycosyltransferase [Bacteroidales bacterium]|nr:glycosyltransferase [Bacteroidales bacterium]